MRQIFKGLALVFVFASMSVQAEESFKEQLFFGNTDSNIDVYVFTDWGCPVCRNLEPTIERMAPSVMKQARLAFVDFVIHPETLNYTPYNLSFMINNKPKYLILRHILTKLSSRTSDPTEEQVEAIAEKVNVTYKPVNYADIALATRYFKELSHQLKVESTPTVIILNRDAKKGKKLVGATEITEENVMEVISALKYVEGNEG